METEWCTLRYALYFFAVVFFIMGVLGIIDGIISICSGGFADNILLGLMIASGFPVMLLGISTLIPGRGK